MSSILKALKRIEGQPPPADAFPALPESVDAKRAVIATARKRRRVRRIMTITVVVLIIAGGAGIAFQNRKYLISIILPDASRPAARQIGPREGQKSKIFRAKVAPAEVRKARKKSSPKRSAPPPEKSKSASAAKTPRPTPEVSSLQPQRMTTTNKTGLKTLSNQNFTPSKKSIAGKRTASRKPVVADRKKPQVRTYARLTDARLKLQALAWSNDASRRMAVINGRIVREGESADGYQINQIRKDDVVVSDGSQSWSLEFGLQQ